MPDPFEVSIYILAGKTAISKAMIPQAAQILVNGMSRPMAPQISATPTITLMVRL